MNIFFIRHGQTKYNAQKKYLGHGTSPFTQLGKSQNANVISRIFQHDIDAVFTSPSPRCLKIAKEIAQCRSILFKEDSLLKEVAFGEFEGLTWQQAKSNYPKEFKSLEDKDTSFRFPDGESPHELDVRAKEFIEKIKSTSYNSIAIVSHGGTIMSMLSQLLELAPEQKWRFKVSHGCLVQVEITNGFAYIVL